MSNQNNPLQIQIVSDVVCPWCIVGYKQLEKAIQETGINAEITWHPFELNPHMPVEGQDLGEHLAEKYGTTPAESASTRDRIKTIGAGLDFEFNFREGMKMYNTFLSHQVLHWAGKHGKQHEPKLELFATHFTHGRDLSSIDVLADAAFAVGLDRDEAIAVMKDGRFVEEVRSEQVEWRQRGVRAVPATVFNQQHLISGAQGEENFVTLLRQLVAGDH